MSTWIVIPPERVEALKALRFNSHWMVHPLGCADRPGTFVVPEDLLRHPQYTEIQEELSGYAVEIWDSEQEALAFPQTGI